LLLRQEKISLDEFESLSFGDVHIKLANATTFENYPQELRLVEVKKKMVTMTKKAFRFPVLPRQFH